MRKVIAFVSVFAIALAVTNSSAARAEGLKRFWTTTGQEPMGHDVDPDFGNRREFFRTNQGSWVERFSDGYLVFFDSVGPQNLQPSTQTGFGKTGGAISGTVIKAASGLEYFIPDQLQVGSILSYRLSAAGTFLPSSPIYSVAPDDSTSQLIVTIATSMAAVRNTLFGAVPLVVDSTGDPEAKQNGYEYRFDAATDSSHRTVYVSNGRIFLVQAYQGDWQTTSIAFGCHLKPVYIQAEADFVPAIIQTGGQWVLTATDAQGSLSLMPGSDTGCGFVNKDVTDRINYALNRDTLKGKAVAALNKAAFPIPISEVWNKIGGPFKGKFGDQSLCFYPRPNAISIGNISGNLDTASVDVTMTASPRAIAETSCAPASSHAFKMLDPNEQRTPSHVVFDMITPYTQIQKTILAAPSVQKAGYTGVTIEPNEAYLTLGLEKQGGQVTKISATPILAIPAEEGDVSLILTFAEVPDGAGTADVSALTGSYTLSMTDQVESLKKALQGQFSAGNLKLNLVQPSFNGLTVTCEADGVHEYVDLRVAAFASYGP